MRWILVLLLALPLAAEQRKLTFEERVELVRGFTAEYATVKTFLPRSKKPLPYPADGAYDKKKWEEQGKEYGPAARVGDLVQISKVDIDHDKILIEINGGFKGGRKWYERIEVGTGTRTTPIATGNSNAPAGTSLVLLFPQGVPPLKAADLKKLLAPVLDFEKRSATEHYVESLPPEIKKAVEEKRAVEGMDREQVILALGRPVRKVRETKDGMELEDWIYGEPPGKMTFVTFNGPKVIRVHETYAGLGQEAPRIKPPL